MTHLLQEGNQLTGAPLVWLGQVDVLTVTSHEWDVRNT